MKLGEHKNTKKQGDAGLGIAIGWFSENGYTVSVPLTDSQDYDLIVDKDDVLQRVQVKTTTYQRKGVYQVSMTIKGGNRSGIGKIKKFVHTTIDLLFVVTSERDIYLIPTDRVLQCFGLGTAFLEFKETP